MAGRKRNLRRQAGNRAGRSLKKRGSVGRSVSSLKREVVSDGAVCDTDFCVGVDGPFDKPVHKAIPAKRYRIAELVDYSGLSRQTIHNYTTMGLIRESSWTDGGHRLYDESAFYRLNQIADLKAQRKSMRFIREYCENIDDS